MHTIEQDERAASATGRRRRRHSEEFKQQLVGACTQPGVSLASVAITNGVNPSMLRRWVVQSGTSAPVRSLPRSASESPSGLQFIPVGVLADEARSSAISIEVKRAGVCVAIAWPVEHAQACAALLREILR